MPRPRSPHRPAFALRVAFIAAAAALLAGCHDFGDVTGSISKSRTPPADETKLKAYADDCGKRYERNPGEKIASIEYARALRALTRYSEAVAVIQTAAIKAPTDFRRARGIWQGAGRRRSTGASQGCAHARLYARQSAMGRHVG